MKYIIRHTAVGTGPAGTPMYHMGQVVEEEALREVCDIEHLLRNQAIFPFVDNAPTMESPFAAPRYGYMDDPQKGPGVVGHVEISTEILTMKRQAEALAAGPGKIINFGPAGIILPNGLMYATQRTPQEEMAFSQSLQRDAEAKAAGVVSTVPVPASAVPSAVADPAAGKTGKAHATAS